MGISKTSLDCYQVGCRKKGGAGPTCSSDARVGLADRAVEGEYFSPQISYGEELI